MISGDWAAPAIIAESLSFPNHNTAIAFAKAKYMGTLLSFWHTDTDLHSYFLKHHIYSAVIHSATPNFGLSLASSSRKPGKTGLCA